MSAQLTDTLKALLIKRKEETLRKAWEDVPAWVFCNEEGRPLDGDNLRHRVFYKVLAQAGMRRIRFHDLRHTFASLLIQNGESLAYVKDQLGHSSIQVTVDIYGHLIPGANRVAIDRLDDATGRNPDATTNEKGATA
jgi:integrase